ncbi:amino acid aminotransferase [Agarivorans sp. 1_MG-2023]|uniref:amino acid aminotransferase n=1 Tax=Agarivorans sp. 1_MG-2023 TaxID=3062634 RepID=UPI0026E156B8|nr:amino acid aminotransferase [Agarivorans sp. 1_MG-2023]MDO6763692.1 amino acid aminotransferase [Agarivorans sp. 1_MG-2023]
MFEDLPIAKDDPILSLGIAYKADPRDNKIDLGIGVYRNEQGQTPVMQAVTAAQNRLLAQQTTQAYIGLAGNAEYNQAMLDLLLTGNAAYSRSIAMQTPGASGALRLLADLIASAKPNATVWLSNPSYVNHQPIMQAAGLKVAFYPYFNPASKQVDEAAMLEQVAKLGPDDVLLLHGCCHNPTGADISFSAWQSITELALKNGFLPFVDLAYQGFGQGLEEDIKGLSHLANRVPELLLASSNSKSFGLYRERSGVAIVVGETLQQATNARGKLFELARRSYTMPPNWGASIVAEILNNSQLKAQWENELNQMSLRMRSLRQNLADEFNLQSNSERFSYFTQHQGMFSLTGFSHQHTEQLREQHAIYIVGGGRINIAGLAQQQIPRLVEACLAVGV